MAQVATLVAAGVLMVILLAGFVLLFADYLGALSPVAALANLQRHPYLGGLGVLLVEEAGIPLPIPGDLTIMYSAHTVPTGFGSRAALWFGLLVAVVSGSSLLYLVGRRWGRRIVHGRVGVALHMTPERLEKTEGFFHKWGFWTILVGRHVPGGRVPLSVAAGIFDVRYPVFLVSVAISSAIWIGIFMVAGVKLGPKVEEMMHAHRTTSVLAPIVVVLALTGYLVFRLITVRGHSEKKR